MSKKSFIVLKKLKMSKHKIRNMVISVIRMNSQDSPLHSKNYFMISERKNVKNGFYWITLVVNWLLKITIKALRIGLKNKEK